MVVLTLMTVRRPFSYKNRLPPFLMQPLVSESTRGAKVADSGERCTRVKHPHHTPQTSTPEYRIHVNVIMGNEVAKCCIVHVDRFKI